MSKSLTINAPQIVQTRNTLNAVPSGSTAEPDYNVKYVPQDLTEAQQAQARQNIGAISESEIPASAQANWNETDTESPAYIQNKPVVAADEITEDRRPSFTLFIDYNKTYDIGSRIVNKYKVYNNGILLTPGGNNGTTYSLTKGKIVFVNTAGDDVRPEAGQFYDTNKPMTWIRMDGGVPFKCVTAATNARIFQKIILSDNGLIEYYGNYGGGLSMPNSPNSVVYFNKYWWSRLSYDGNPTWYGKIIFANVEVPTNTADIDPTHQPNVSNMDGIYVHRSKETDFKNWLTGLYQSGADLSALFAKIKPYDYLSQYDENCPGDAPQPIVLPTVPLTMTDENSTVISGNFVAQDVTITPAS